MASTDVALPRPPGPRGRGGLRAGRRGGPTRRCAARRRRLTRRPLRARADHSMSVSIDGFITDRQGAFAWTTPSEELFRFPHGAGRRARRLPVRPQALRDDAAVGDGPVDARRRARGRVRPTSGARSRRSSSAVRSTACGATHGSPRRHWPRRSPRRSTRPTRASRSAAPAWPRRRSSWASSTSCAYSATRSSPVAARRSCRRHRSHRAGPVRDQDVRLARDLRALRAPPRCVGLTAPSDARPPGTPPEALRGCRPPGRVLPRRPDEAPAP